jgi:hypothetical protein
MLAVQPICSLLRAACTLTIADFTSPRKVAVLTLGVPMLVLTSIGSSFAQSPPAPASDPASVQQPSARILKNWREDMARVPLPKPGCFTASHPSTEWQEIPCKTAREIPFLPASGPVPPTVGNGSDVAVQVTTGQISAATGSFDSVTGVTSETGMVNNKGPQVPNSFSLQLNSNLFNTSTCPVGPTQCQGWQQFIYSNTTDNGALIQYWLIQVPGSSPFTCPSGWKAGPGGCFMSSPVVPVPSQLITSLINLSLMGQANVSGSGMDQVIISTGATLYAQQNPANILNLSSQGSWTGAEFNIVGDAGGSTAYFNSGSTIVVRVSVNNGTPTAPSCTSLSAGFLGFTGETNNLSFAGPPAAAAGSSPAVVFMMSSAGDLSLPCAASKALPAKSKLVDTHDFNGDAQSDLIWYNTDPKSGKALVLLVNGTSVIGGGLAGSLASPWAIVGQRDFNGDGFADILWRNGSTGQLLVWLLNGQNVISAGSPGSAATPWVIVGTGDFNGDGRGDVLWYNASTGQAVIWLLNGTSVIGGGSPGSAPSPWAIAGTGDFNGDGFTDILWYNPSNGQLVVWLIQCTTTGSCTSIGGGSPGSVASPWTVAQTGDFNGDGMTDIVWSNSTSGQLVIWLMNGASMLGGGSLGGAASPWQIQGMNSD